MSRVQRPLEKEMTALLLNRPRIWSNSYSKKVKKWSDNDIEKKLQARIRLQTMLINKRWSEAAEEFEKRHNLDVENMYNLINDTNYTKNEIDQRFNKMEKNQEEIKESMEEVKAMIRNMVVPINQQEQEASKSATKKISDYIKHAATPIEVYLQTGEDLLTLILSPIGDGYAKDNFLRFFKNFIKSSLTASMDIIFSGFKIGRDLIRSILSIPTPSKAFDHLWNVFKQITSLIVSIIVAYMSISCIWGIAYSIDTIFSTTYSNYVSITMEELAMFAESFVIDTISLIPKLLVYIFSGKDYTKGMGVKELWKSNSKIFWICRQILDVLFNLLKDSVFRIFKGLSDIPIMKDIFSFLGDVWTVGTEVWVWVTDNFNAVLNTAKERAAEIARLVLALTEQLKKFSKSIDFQEIKNLPYNLYDGVKNAAGSIGNMPGKIRQLITGTDTLKLPGLYDAYHVAKTLNVSMDELKKHPNKKLVKYALNNTMNKLQLLHVVYHLQAQVRPIPALKF